MKTTISVQKTENRNFKAPNMKTLTVLICMALFGFIASVQATVHKKTGAEGNKPVLASASVISLTPSSVRMPSADAFLEVNAEEMLEVENWMINESYFASPVAAAEREVALNVEEWMLSEQNFSKITVVEERENTLEVEDWMLNKSVWGN